MKNTQYALVGILIFVVGSGAFYGGMQYQKSLSGTQGTRQNAFRSGAAGGMGGGNFQGGGRGAQGGLTNGEILSIDDQGLTLKLLDGGSKIIFFSASTTISKMDSGIKDDLKQGANVMITGTSNSDGSITANTVQIRPIHPVQK